MRVAFDGRSLASPVLRGWDRYALGLIRELVRLGVEITLFHRAHQPLFEPHVAGLDCRRLGLHSLRGLQYEQVVVPLALRRGRFELFHAPFEHGVPLVAPCPVVLTIHSVTDLSYADLVERGLLPGQVSDYLGPRPSRKSWRAHYLPVQIARARHILVPSEFCRDEVIRFLHIPPERVTTTRLALGEQFQKPPRPPAERAEALERLRVRRPYLLYVGGYEPHKNVQGLLDAFALVHADRPELALVTVGSKAVPDELRQHAEAVGLVPGRDVIFLVGLTEELNDLYDDAELLVTLSWRETFCLPALEAMSRGTPVVASAWGATPEVVGQAGRLVDPRDAAAARAAILELLASDREPLRQACLAQANQFSWAQTAEQTLAVYQALLKDRSRHPAPRR